MRGAASLRASRFLSESPAPAWGGRRHGIMRPEAWTGPGPIIGRALRSAHPYSCLPGPEIIAPGPAGASAW